MDGPATESATATSPAHPKSTIGPVALQSIAVDAFAVDAFAVDSVTVDSVTVDSVTLASSTPGSADRIGSRPPEVPRGVGISAARAKPVATRPTDTQTTRPAAGRQSAPSPRGAAEDEVATQDPAAHQRAAAWPAALVAEVMSRPVLTIDATESLWDAWQLLSISGLRHLAVVSDDRCVGIISDRNILSDVPVSQERMRTRSVGEVVSPGTNRSVQEGDQLVQVARIMARHSLEAVPVVGPCCNIVGIVTGSDLVRWWAADGT